MIKAHDRLEQEGQWTDCRAELRELFDRLNTATDGTCRLEAEYVTIAISPRKP